MPESTVADFPARMNLAGDGQANLEEARVMMSQQRVIITSDDQLVTAPLSAVTDVAVGETSPDLDVGSDRPISIGFTRDGSTRVVTIVARPDHARRFVEMLFRLLLNGTTTHIASPVTDDVEVTATLSVEDGTVRFDLETGSPVVIDRADIEHVATGAHLAGADPPRTRILAPSGPGPDEVLVRTSSARLLNLLVRYLRDRGGGSPEQDTTTRILLVDDDPTMIEVLEAFIQRERDDVKVTGATSAMDGLQVLADGPSIDAIVSDYHMPRMDGIEFLRAVREDHPNLPFILFTGRGNESVIKAAITAGVTDYVEKRLGSGQHRKLVEHIEQAIETDGVPASG